MALNKGLMDRLGDRKAGNKAASGIQANLSLDEKRVHIFHFVAASIMPRDIVLTGGDFKLVLTASNRHLVQAALYDGGKSVFQDNFAESKDQDVDAATKRGLLDAILLFLNQPGDIDVKFERTIGEFDDSNGVHAELISSDQELPEPAPEIEAEPLVLQEPVPTPGIEQMVAEASEEKAEAEQREEARAKARYIPPADVEAGSNDGSSISATGVPGGIAQFSGSASPVAKRNDEPIPVPYDFVELTRPQAASTLYFSYDGENSFKQKKRNDAFIDRADMPRIAAWHKNTSDILGEELFVIFVPADVNDDRFAISINSNEGSGISFGPKKMGQICAAWLKSWLENR